MAMNLWTLKRSDEHEYLWKMNSWLFMEDEVMNIYEGELIMWLVYVIYSRSDSTRCLLFVLFYKASINAAVFLSKIIDCTSSTVHFSCKFIETDEEYHSHSTCVKKKDWWRI